MLFIWESHEAHCSLSGTAVFFWPSDSVVDTAIGHPAHVTVVISHKVPGNKYLTHFLNLSTITETNLHYFIISQLGGVAQVVKTATVVGYKTKNIVSAFIFISKTVVLDTGHHIWTSAGFSGLCDGVLHRPSPEPTGIAPVQSAQTGILQLVEGGNHSIPVQKSLLCLMRIELVVPQLWKVREYHTL